MSATLARPRPRARLAEPVNRPRGRRWPLFALAALYATAFAYHGLQSRGHLTPAVFPDELLFAKLAQSLAAGDGLALRGETYLFPAPLAPLLQAPAWLVDSAPTAYALAKLLQTAVMAAAVFPAYWLARQLVRPAFALVVAAAAVVAPAMLYHSYLMTEALAYPVFLLAVAVMTRAVARPGRRWELAVVGVSLLAVLTRTQFAALALAFVVAAPAAGVLRGEGLRPSLRRHRLSLALLLTLGAVAFAGAVAGQYRGALSLDYHPGEVLHWAVLTAALLPFAAGWLVVPGAVLGAALMLVRPRWRAEAGFAALTLVAGTAFVLQAALISAGEADRPLERYTYYLLPLVFVAFFAYLERGTPHRRVHAGIALALGAVAVFVPLHTLADYLFSFDSPTLSAFGVLADRLTDGDAAAIFVGCALLGSLVVAALSLRGRVPAALAVVSAVLMLVTGAVAYEGDHRMTQRAQSTWAGSPPSWLDELGADADYLALPGGSAHLAWNLESWNRRFGRPIHLGETEGDAYPSSRARIDGEGRLLVDGRHPGPGSIVVGHFGTAIELEGDRLATGRPGVTLFRIPRAPRVRSLAVGVYHDRFARALVTFRAWPAGRPQDGRFRARLVLPLGVEPRTVELSVAGGVKRTVRLLPGTSVTVELPVRGYPPPVLRIRTDRANVREGRSPNPRLVALRIPILEFVETQG